MTNTPSPTLSLTPPDVPTVPYDATLGGAASSLANAMLGPFEVGEVVGQGGMGIVFAGEHLVQGVTVAVKVITRRGAEHPHIRQSLRNEVQAVAALNHPSIVRVLDYGDIGRDAEEMTSGQLRAGSPYFVMEYLPAGTITGIVGKVTWKQSKAILLTVLDALAHAHSLGLVHRDIKPGNILLGEFGGRVIPKLADFGLAFATETSSHQSRSIGTPQYMAPEQIQQSWRTHGPWSDLYSLGCVAFELVTGKRLFRGKTVAEIIKKHMNGERRPLRTVLTLPDEFRGWLEQMLAVDPVNRFRSAADAARALMAIDDSGVPDIRPPRHTTLAIGGLTPVLDVFHQSSKRDEQGFQRVWSSINHGLVEDVSEIPERWDTPRFEPAPMKLVGAGLGLFGLRTIPLVGRSDELEVMWQTLRHAAAEKRVQVVTVRGTEGSGKSRLGDWFVQRVQELGVATVLRATHSSQGGVADGLARMMARHFRTLGSTRVETSVVVREAMFAQGIEDLYDWRAMAALVAEGMDFEDEAINGAFEFTSPRQRYAIVRKYLGALSQTSPVVVWLDDVHWGAESLELAEYLTSDDKGAGMPVVVILGVTDEIIAQTRDEREILESVSASDHAIDLSLRPLSASDHELLIREVANLESDLTLELGERTIGNPRLAVELIGDWVARGVLEVGETGFVLRRGARATIPDSLHEVWDARIRELESAFGHDARIALELAAALGHDVDSTEWEAVCRVARITLDPELIDVLFGRRFARRTETGWAFTHAIIRESLERSARDSGRWREHLMRCSYLVEIRHDVSRPWNAERYGRYLVGAEEYERALEPLMTGAAGRRRSGEYRAAEGLLTRYLRALEKLEAPEHDPRWGQVWATRAHVHTNAHDPKSASRWARRAVEAAEKYEWDDVLVDATTWLAVAKRWLGEDDAVEVAHRAYTMLSFPDSQPTIAAFGFLAHLLTSMREFDQAEALLNEALGRAEDERDIAHNHMHRCRLSIMRKDYDQARESGETALALLERLGHYPAMAGCLEYLAEVERVTGDTEQAVALYTRCIGLQNSLGLPAVISQLNLASILMKDDEFSEAEQLYVLAAETLNAMGRRRLEIAATAGILAAAAGLQRWSSVTSLCERISTWMDDAMEMEPEIASYLELAGDLCARGQQEYEAETVYALALRQWDHVNDPDKVANVQAKVDALDFFP